MSKDIWHTADITPEPCRILICKTNKGQNYTAIIPSPQEWNTMILSEFYNLGDIDNAERIEQYAYLDDLLALETELERTRKALDVKEKQVEISKKALSFINENWDNADCGRKELGACAFNAIEDISAWEEDIAEIKAITALEQKE